MTEALQLPRAQACDLADIEVEQLSPRLRLFVEKMGLPATLHLVQAYGGRRLYVPTNPSPEHALAKLIGMDALRNLCRLHGDTERVLIPKADYALSQARNRRIRSQYGPKSIRMLAEEYQISERRVFQIVAEPAGGSRQARTAATTKTQQQLFD